MPIATGCSSVARVAVGLVALSACGGGGSGDAAEATSSPTEGSETAATVSAGDASASGEGTTTPGADTTAGATSSASVGDATASDATQGEGTDATQTTGDGTGGDDSTGTTGIGGEANVLYVRDDGENGDPGTVDAPMRTIQWAIAQAEQQGDIDTIRVAEGEYAIDYADDDHIVMVEGVSLFGGYRADWGDRDAAQYVTRVVDATRVPVESSENSPHCAIEIPAGVTSTTVLDGFHVGMAMGSFRAAVLVRGDATIRGNVIDNTVDGDGIVHAGVRVIDSGPTILDNRIRFDVIDDSGTSIGISTQASDGLFVGNIIDMSGALDNAYGMRLTLGAPQVLGNSIYLQDGTNMIGIWVITSTPVIDNNLIESEQLSAVCIWSSNAASVPTSARNNVLDCNYTLFGSEPFRNWTTIVEFEGGLANASDNVKLPATIVGPDDDMVLDAQSPCTVTQGGRDITGEAPADLDGVARTVPLSIGAHEWDGGCQ